jgi:glutaminyl-tRNA synthetase
MTTQPAPEESPRDFIRDLVAADVAVARYPRIVTRFPPEPNGYLHIGHAKSICLNFGIAREFQGICHLRMDDTNPTKEEMEYVDSIERDVRWLIAGWADHVLGLKRAGTVRERLVGPEAEPGQGGEPFYASDYFEQLYEYALELVRAGKAYVCDLTPEDMDTYRGAPDQPGRESPWRERPVAENLDLLTRMRAGEFPEGAHTLRAKIDMASSNVWMRDPVLYRIRHAEHHHVRDRWCLYPMYDFAHCLSDSIEGISHSICTLEFEVHRPLYDWILDNLKVPQPRPYQYEFARLNLSTTVMSKRKLLQLVQEGRVSGWDDPRMPTIAGLRRRGVPAAAIRTFCQRIGVTKYDGLTDIALLEFTIREELNRTARRALAVLRPLKVVVENYPEDRVSTSKPSTTRKTPVPGNAKSRSPASSTSNATISWRNHRRNSSGSAPAARSGCAMPTSSSASGSSRMPQGQVTELRCSIDPSHGAAAHRRSQGQRHGSLGLGGACHRRRSSPL